MPRARRPSTVPKTEMLINYVPGEESRIAIVRDGRLEEFYQERASAESHVGNIYQGKVANVEPSIQAAFVDFGLERNGFLHISDLHPKHFPGKDREEFEQVGSKTPHRDRPPIQKCLRRGDVVLVQVLKEGIGTKGPTLTSYLSIPGRFLVMMPDMQRTGVSRKVDDDDARREMRKILDELDPPKEFGFIVRTAGIGQTKTELKRDLAYLQRLWKNLERRRKQLKGPGELYTESDLVIRTIRDIYSTDIDRIIVDDPTAARRAYDFLTIASPRSRAKVIFYDDPVPLYHRFDIESQIESIHSREVPLPSGGGLVIDQTEALVAIDVNSGKSREARDAETNAYKTNLEAVDEICRQLRLRDMGGVVVNDLIDMRDAKHRRAVESRFRENLKRDRARTRIGSISQFGILEMTRQRMRPSLKTSLYTHCLSCAGSGHVKTPESVVLDVMRRLALAMHHKAVARIELTISPDVAFQLLNRKRGQLVALEKRFDKGVMVRVGGTTMDYVRIAAFDARGGEVEPDSLSSTRGLAAESEKSPQMFVELTGEPTDFEIIDDAEVVETDDTAADDEASADAEGLSEASSETVAGGEGGEDRGEGEGEGEGKRRRRRRRRGGRRRRKGGGDVGEGAEHGGDETDDRGVDASSHGGESPEPEAAADMAADAEAAADDEPDAGTRSAESVEDFEASAGQETDGEAAGEPREGGAPRKRRRRRRGRRRGGEGEGGDQGGGQQGVQQGADDADAQGHAVNGQNKPVHGGDRLPAPSQPTISGGYANRMMDVGGDGNGQ
jgi:ribonuclease E